MNKRLIASLAATAVLCLTISGVALAAPSITAFGKTNRIVRDVRSLKTARIYARTDTAGAYATIEVLSYRGVVRRLYSGPAATPGGYLWTAPWNGTDYLDRKLPNGTYQYRVRVNKGGQTATAVGLISVRDSEVNRPFLCAAILAYAKSGSEPGCQFTVAILRLGQDQAGGWWALAVLKPTPNMDWPTVIMHLPPHGASWVGVDFGTGLDKYEVPVEVRSDLF